METDTIITLENQKEYLIVDKIQFQHVDYYYLCSTTKPVEVKIAVEKDQELYFVEDTELLTSVYDVFVEHIKEKIGIKEG